MRDGGGNGSLEVPRAHQKFRRAENIRIKNVTRIATATNVGGALWKVTDDFQDFLASVIDDLVWLAKRTQKLHAMSKVRGLSGDGLRGDAALCQCPCEVVP